MQGINSSPVFRPVVFVIRNIFSFVYETVQLQIYVQLFSFANIFLRQDEKKYVFVVIVITYKNFTAKKYFLEEVGKRLGEVGTFERGAIFGRFCFIDIVIKFLEHGVYHKNCP